MALRVPTSDGVGVSLNRLPQVQQRGRSVGDFINPDNAMFAEAAGNAAQTVERASMALKMRELQDIDRTRTQDAINQTLAFDQDLEFGENGWRKQTGAAVLSQANSKPLTDNVLDTRQQHINQIIQGLGNDSQRLAFQEWADRSSLQLRQQLMSHENEQYRVYKRGVLRGGIDTATRDIELFNNDPARIGESLANIKRYSEDLGLLEHGSAEIGQLDGRRHVSGAIIQAIDTSLQQGNIANAWQLHKQFGPEMELNDYVKAAKVLNTEHERQTALQVGQTVIGELYPRMQTGDGDRALNILAMTESGNRQFNDDGSVVTSPAGAVGKMQILPSTGPEAAKLAGLPWNPELFYRKRTGDAKLDKEAEDYNFALGSAYFQHQMVSFGGNLSKAYAAYNAGAGSVRNALKLAESTGLPWSGFLPDETQAYVAKNMKAFAAGQGQYQRPTLADAQQTALDKLGPNPSAELVKLTMDMVEKHYNDQTKAIKQRQEEATGNAMRMILENGGDFAGLPPQVRGSVPIEDVDKVMAFAKKINAREPIETDWGLYYRMKSNPQLLKDTNLMAFRDKLSDSEFKGLSEEQQQLNNRNSSMTSVRSPKQILDQFMLEAGIDPSPKAGSKDAEKVGRLWAAYEQQIGQAEQDSGKKLSNDEMRQVAARLFVDVQLKRSFWFDETRPAGLVGSDELKNIVVPAAERQAIIDAWNQAGRGRAITENDIVTMYARRQGLL